MFTPRQGRGRPLPRNTQRRFKPSWTTSRPTVRSLGLWVGTGMVGAVRPQSILAGWPSTSASMVGASSSRSASYQVRRSRTRLPRRMDSFMVLAGATQTVDTLNLADRSAVAETGRRSTTDRAAGTSPPGPEYRRDQIDIFDFYGFHRFDFHRR